jgi:hypothetical protein
MGRNTVNSSATSKASKKKRRSREMPKRRGHRRGAEELVSEGRTVQISFRVRPTLKRDLQDEANRQRVTLQSLILQTLLDAGLPVEEVDLEDAWKSRSTGRRRNVMNLAAGKGLGREARHAADLSIADLLGGGRGDVPLSLVVVNCGCATKAKATFPRRRTKTR